MKNFFENVTTLEGLKSAISSANSALHDVSGKDLAAQQAAIITSSADAVKAVNEAFLKEYLADLMLKEDPHAILMAYLSGYKCDRVSVKVDKKAGDLNVEESAKIANFLKVERAFQCHKSTQKDEKGNILPNKSVTIASNKNYDLMLAAFVDNVAIATSQEIKSQFDSPMAVASKKALNMEKTSNTALIEQLNIVVTAIMGKDAPKMIAADLKYIKIAVSKAADCKVTMARETTYYNAIVEAIDVRKNNRAYTFQSKAACHKVQTPKNA